MIQIEIDNGSGFCFGVTTAIKKAEEKLAEGETLYCLGDIVHNGMDLAILDTSAACHMPDVLEMPYTPVITSAYYGDDKEKYNKYRLGGPTCLAGDVIGDYYFKEPLKIGDRLVFTDMAIYSMVKNNTFNGMPLPAIIAADSNGEWKIVKKFGYTDFKMRLS